MADDKQSNTGRRPWLLRDLKDRCEGTVGERVDRYLRLDPQPIIAGTTFAPASAECIELFRDGHFYGCISLSQAVGEALVRHMCQSNGRTPAANFERNVSTLKRHRCVDETVEANLLRLWERRDDYHHLNPSVLTERAQLEELAFAKARALALIEAWVFGFTPSENGLILHHPQYWPNTGPGRTEVFLRCDPAV